MESQALTLSESFGKVKQGLKDLLDSQNRIELLILDFVGVLRETAERAAARSLELEVQPQAGFSKMEDIALDLESATESHKLQAGFLEDLLPAAGVLLVNFVLLIGKLQEYLLFTGVLLWEWHLLVLWMKSEMRGVLLLIWTDWKRRKKKTDEEEP